MPEERTGSETELTSAELIGIKREYCELSQAIVQAVLPIHEKRGAGDPYALGAFAAQERIAKAIFPMLLESAKRHGKAAAENARLVEALEEAKKDAAHEADMASQANIALSYAVLEERETCAKIAEEERDIESDNENHSGGYTSAACDRIATRIRGHSTRPTLADQIAEIRHELNILLDEHGKPPIPQPLSQTER